MSWTRTVPSAAAQFAADPVGWMNDNILVVAFEGGPNDTLNDTPLDLCLIKRSPAAGKASKLGRLLGLFAIGTKSFVPCVANVESVSPPFKAYFCPYRGGQTLGTMIGSNANFMFTTQMDGCSLGIGMPNGTGGRYIYHSNVGGNIQQQSTNLNTVMGRQNIQTIWEPGNYRFEFGQAELCCTTFGVRDTTTGTWSFYGQTYSRAYTNPDKFYLREVKHIV